MEVSTRSRKESRNRSISVKRKHRDKLCARLSDAEGIQKGILHESLAPLSKKKFEI